MDVTDTITPRSDQWNADDLMAGPRTVTIASVSAGAAEQPIDVHLVETPDRAYRPSKSMRRVLVSAYGPDSDAWIGKRLTLYREATIKFGKDEVGGIRISHMSGIDRALKVALTVTRGKREPFVVEPLREAAPAKASKVSTPDIDAALAAVLAATDIDAIRRVWTDHNAAAMSDDDRQRLTEAMTDRKAELVTEPTLDGAS